MATTPGCSTNAGTARLMRAVVQRVQSATVRVDDEVVAEIGPGLTVLLGIGARDRAEDGERLAAKIAELRIFPDAGGRMNLSVKDADGSILVIPQFTLYADVRHGRRPDFGEAAAPEDGRRFIDAFCGWLRAHEMRVAAGRFGAHMRIAQDVDGPVTIVATTDGWTEGDIAGPKGG